MTSLSFDPALLPGSKPSFGAGGAKLPTPSTPPIDPINIPQIDRTPTQPGFDPISRGELGRPAEPRPVNTMTQRWVKEHGVLETVITIRDLGAGIRQYGELSQVFPGTISASTGVSHWPGYFMLPLDLNNDDSTNPLIANSKGVHHYNIFDTCALGVGSTANFNLFVGSSAGGVSARTFTLNGGSLTTLFGARIGGATIAERLIVGCSGGAAEVLSDLASTPTSAGDMHADTNPLWGGITSPLDKSIVLYCADALKTLQIGDAIGTQPVATGTVLASGGFHGGLTWARGRLEMWWVEPRQSTAAGILATNGFTLGGMGTIVFTNPEGTNGQILAPSRNRVYSAANWEAEDAIVWTDTKDVYLYQNGRPFNLRMINERQWSGLFGVSTSDLELRCLALATVTDALYAKVGLYNTSGVPQRLWIERMDRATRIWSQVSEIQTYTGTGIQYRHPQIPWAYDDRLLFWARRSNSTSATDTFTRQVVPQTENPFWSLTSQHGTGRAHNASASVDSTMWRIPHTMGMPSILAWTKVGSELGKTAATGAKTTITVGTMGTHRPTFTGAPSHDFNQADPIRKRVQFYAGNTDAFDLFQFRATIEQGTGDTSSTPNLLPIEFTILSFPDGRVRPPEEIYGPYRENAA